MRHLVVVPHTHWDREWYLTHEAFRFRLVHLLDDVLDLLERDPAFRHFTLDGQTIVLADYLEVRPGARERIAKLVRDGRLLVGPWFVLPDEWLVSGEALIRNLRRGLAGARALGPVMRIGYVPDQFGHVGQLPAAAGRLRLRGRDALARRPRRDRRVALLVGGAGRDAALHRVPDARLRQCRPPPARAGRPRRSGCATSPSASPRARASRPCS